MFCVFSAIALRSRPEYFLDVFLFFLCGTALVFIRDSWAYFVPAIPLACFFAGSAGTWRGRFGCLFLLISLAGVSALGIRVADLGERFVYPLENTIFARILPDPAAKAYFTDRGMPGFEHLASDCEVPSGDCPITDAELDWFKAHGKSTYESWILTTLPQRLKEVYDRRNEMFADNNIYDYYIGSERPTNLTIVGFVSAGNLIGVWFLLLFVTLMIECGCCFGFGIRVNFRDMLGVLGIIFVSFGSANALATYWGDSAFEFDRHLLMPFLAVNLGLTVMILHLADQMIDHANRKNGQT